MFFLVFINCNNKDEFIYSNIDGLNHKEILGGPENIEKHSLELIYQIDTTLSMEYFNILLLKLNEGKDIWRPYYFNALSLYCNRISLDDKSKLEYDSGYHLKYVIPEYHFCFPTFGFWTILKSPT